MFFGMKPVRTERFSANEREYELHLVQVDSTGQYRLFVSSGGFGVGHTFIADDDVVRDAVATGGPNVIESLFSQARDDITRNEFGTY